MFSIRDTFNTIKGVRSVIKVTIRKHLYQFVIRKLPPATYKKDKQNPELMLSAFGIVKIASSTNV